MKKVFIILIFVFMLIFIENINNINEENKSPLYDNEISTTTINVFNKKLVSLTFDDGPSNNTKEIVDLLNSYNIKATFFILGEKVNRYSEELLYIVENNHELGNHSYSHPNFKTLSIIDGLNEINRTNDAIFKIANCYPKSFRFPYGSYHDKFLNYIELPIVLWNVDSLDWKYLNDNLIIRNVIENLFDESVILFHDFSNFKKDAVITIIEFLLDHDYEFVTVSQMFTFDDNIIHGKVYY